MSFRLFQSQFLSRSKNIWKLGKALVFFLQYPHIDTSVITLTFIYMLRNTSTNIRHYSRNAKYLELFNIWILNYVAWLLVLVALGYSISRIYLLKKETGCCYQYVTSHRYFAQRGCSLRLAGPPHVRTWRVDFSNIQLWSKTCLAMPKAATKLILSFSTSALTFIVVQSSRAALALPNPSSPKDTFFFRNQWYSVC